MNGSRNIVLVGTYRPANEAWIRDRRLYNLPLPKILSRKERKGRKVVDARLPCAATADGHLAFHEKISGVVLFAEGHPNFAFKAKFKDVVDGAWLKKNGYSLSEKPHGEKYALYELCEESTPAKLLGVKSAEVFVSSSRCPCVKIDEAFYSRPYPVTGGKSMPYVFDCLKPYFKKWKSATTFNPVQMDFLGLMFDERKDTITSICGDLSVRLNTPAWPDAFGAALKRVYKSRGNLPIRTLSLFSGAGGLDIGFSDVGFQIVESVEIEDKFCETLEMNSGEGKRFDGSKVNCIDIREYNALGVGNIDFIIGGPPCQTFSAAGRRANGVLGTTDARGVLFREYVRLLKQLTPRGFLFENVYGITGAQNGEAWKEIKEAFRSAGYRIFHRILDAADYGVPQHRERLIIVGLRKGKFRFPRPTHGPDSFGDIPFYDAGTAVKGVRLSLAEAKPGLGGRFGHLLPGIPPGLNYSFYTEKMGHPNPVFAWRSKFSDFLYKADPAAPVRTIKASGGAYTGPLHWGNRFFSLGEYKRLQTFPDDYLISGTKQIAVKQIGNSVPPQLARMLALAIQQQVFDADMPFILPLLGDAECLTFRKRKSTLTKTYRGKALNAIGEKTSETRKMLATAPYYCSLSDTFKFEKKDSAEDGDFKVSFAKSSGLVIKEACASDAVKSVKIHIRVSPASKDWVIGADEVDISVYSKKESAFTVGWKAFEQLISDCEIKADLVQLNGYYQYTPKIRCSCEFFEDFPFRDIVAGIVEGENVAKILSTAQLSKAWAVSQEVVWDIAEFLRKLGYEVRNSNTNPQIPENHWLLPYSFPTLTQRSVQLGKKIR